MIIKASIIFIISFLFILLPRIEYWGAWHSEESAPPSVCRFGDLVVGFNCSGRFCDNVRVGCQGLGRRVSNRYWTTSVSEEGSGIGGVTGDGDPVSAGNRVFCGFNGFMSGVACSGDFCDNLSLECITISDGDRVRCRWSDWVSEEGTGRIDFPEGFFAAGMECRGSNCDDKRFYICQISSR